MEVFDSIYKENRMALINIPKQALVVFAGVPGAGKSTLCKKWLDQPQWQAVSTDYLRGVVSDSDSDQSASRDAFELLSFILDKRMRRGVGTVVDSTALTARARKSLLDVAAKYNRPTAIIVLNTSLDEALEGQKERVIRPIPYEVTVRMHNNLAETLTAVGSESWDSVHVITRSQSQDITGIHWI